MAPADHRSSLREPSALWLHVLGQRVRIRPATSVDRTCLHGNFRALAVEEDTAEPDLDYTVRHKGSAHHVERLGEPIYEGFGLGNLLYAIEKDLTVELQRRRPALLFLHSAAVVWKGKAILLAGDSGSGKSTTTWALLHHGFSYSSDELSPIDLQLLQVESYPHALCLKRPPPAPYKLPASAMHLGRTIHVPTTSLPSTVSPKACALGTVFLVKHQSGMAEPRLSSISSAEAGMRLYGTALNALSHRDAGLDAVLKITAKVPCFTLATADLTRTCILVRDTADSCPRPDRIS